MMPGVGSRSIRSRLLQWIGRVLLSRADAGTHTLRIVNRTRQTELGNRIETADRGPKRRKGLLGRDGLAAGEGLWIVPCEAVHTFAMRFPIDLVYLDRALRVVKVRHNVVPGRISACLRAHSVIELPTGAVRHAQVQPGDMLDFEAL
jgi:uncharacterized membrane protein (UPF0127 family)